MRKCQTAMTQLLLLLLLLLLLAQTSVGRPPEREGREANDADNEFKDEFLDSPWDGKAKAFDGVEEKKKNTASGAASVNDHLLLTRQALIDELERRQLEKRRKKKSDDGLSAVYHGGKKIGKAVNKEAGKAGGGKARKRKKTERKRKMYEVMPAPFWILGPLLAFVVVVLLSCYLCLKYCCKGTDKTRVHIPPSTIKYVDLNVKEKPEYGTIMYSLEYDLKRNSLLVTVINCLGLPRGIESIDPYAVIRLEGVKNTEERSKVIKSCTDPVFNYCRSFKIKKRAMLKQQVIVIEIYDWDISANHRMIAMRTIRLENLGEDLDSILGRPVDYTANLKQGIDLFSRGVGDICLALSYSPTKKQMKVGVIECKAVFLQNAGQVPDLQTLPNTFVQVTLLHINNKSDTRRSGVVKQNRNPYFNFTCSFTLDYEKDSAARLKLQLLHKTETLGIKRLVGSLELSSECNKESLPGLHWEEVMNSGGAAVSKWHSLISPYS